MLDPPPPTSVLGKLLQAVVDGVTGALNAALVHSGLAPPVSREDAAVETIAKNLRITPVRRTQIIEVDFRARTPQAAHTVLSEIVRLHLAKVARVNASSESYEFYRTQAAQLAVSLREAENALAGSTDGPCGVAESMRGHGQQERPHSLWAVMTREQGFDARHVSEKPRAKMAGKCVAPAPSNPEACAA